MPEDKTPVPSNGNGNGIRLRASWSAVLTALTIIAGLATKYVYATKAELGDHASSEAAVVAEVKAAAAKAETQTAVNTKELEVHDKEIDRLLDYAETANSNIATIMRAIEIPADRIARPKRKKE